MNPYHSPFMLWFVAALFAGLLMSGCAPRSEVEDHVSPERDLRRGFNTIFRQVNEAVPPPLLHWSTDNNAVFVQQMDALMDLWQADLEARRREIDGFQERYHQAPAIDEVVADRDLVHASSWQLYYYGLAIQSLRQIRRYPQEFGFHDDQRIVEWEDRFHGQLHEDWPGFLELTRLHAQSRPRLCVRLAVIMGEAYRLNHQRPDLLPFSEVDEEKVFQQLQEVFTFSLEDFDEPNRSVLQALQVNAVCEFLQWSLGLVLADVEQEHLAIRALAQWRILQSEGIVALAADDPKINSSSGLAYIFAAQVFSALGHQSEAMALVQRLSDSNNFLSWNARLWARCFE